VAVQRHARAAQQRGGDVQHQQARLEAGGDARGEGRVAEDGAGVRGGGLYPGELEVGAVAGARELGGLSLVAVVFAVVLWLWLWLGLSREGVWVGMVVESGCGESCHEVYTTSEPRPHPLPAPSTDRHNHPTGPHLPVDLYALDAPHLPPREQHHLGPHLDRPRLQLAAHSQAAGFGAGDVMDGQAEGQAWWGGGGGGGGRGGGGVVRGEQ